MNYVYKVVGNFNEDNFNSIIKKLQQSFVFIYINKTLFISSKNYDLAFDSKKKLNNIFKPIRDFYIEPVDEKNINEQQPFAKEWCLNNLVRLDTERYEQENQNYLKEVWKAMDNMEFELAEKLQQKFLKDREGV